MMKCIICLNDTNERPNLCTPCENTLNDYSAEVVTDGSRIADSVRESIRSMVGASLREARKAAVGAKNENQFIENLQKKILR